MFKFRLSYLFLLTSSLMSIAFIHTAQALIAKSSDVLVEEQEADTQISDGANSIQEDSEYGLSKRSRAELNSKDYVTFDDRADPTMVSVKRKKEKRTYERTPWGGGLGMGLSMSQLLTQGTKAVDSKVVDNSLQLDLGVSAARDLTNPKASIPVAVEAGIGIGSQFISNPNYKEGTSFAIRYLNVPVGTRAHFTREISAFLGVSAIVPMDSLEGIPEEMKLTTTNVAVAFGGRYEVPANKSSSWYVELSGLRGLFHVGAPGGTPLHVRNFGASVGMASRF